MNNSSEQGTQFCPKCGQAVAVGTQFCPKCGTQLTQSQPQQPTAPVQPVQASQQSQTTAVHPTTIVKKGVDHFALIGLILGLISWLLNFWGIVGITAVVFSAIALNRHVSGTDKTFAIIGLASGIFNILYAVMQL
ncbi:zinc-ribbon domain-containing protein [Levilactobacillus paucivorans]|uniref:zinc-ribbon domain-containing protein n=1 Tax=Levilactobacillus paucivorans TaxID=616990 RepID=UPI00070D1171|nr:zinc ribbon domain-containing protein [Levilactobacillus paucivorans]